MRKMRACTGLQAWKDDVFLYQHGQNHITCRAQTMLEQTGRSSDDAKGTNVLP